MFPWQRIHGPSVGTRGPSFGKADVVGVLQPNLKNINNLVALFRLPSSAVLMISPTPANERREDSEFEQAGGSHYTSNAVVATHSSVGTLERSAHSLLVRPQTRRANACKA